MTFFFNLLIKVSSTRKRKLILQLQTCIVRHSSLICHERHIRKYDLISECWQFTHVHTHTHRVVLVWNTCWVQCHRSTLSVTVHVCRSGHSFNTKVYALTHFSGHVIHTSFTRHRNPGWCVSYGKVVAWTGFCHVIKTQRPTCQEEFSRWFEGVVLLKVTVFILKKTPHSHVCLSPSPSQFFLTGTFFFFFFKIKFLCIIHAFW